MTDTGTVAIVDDEFLIAHDLKMMCESMGLTVVGVAKDADTARKLLAETDPEFVLMDVRLQGKRDGVDLAIEVHDRSLETKIIFITGSNEPPTMARIEMDNPHRVLIKPIGRDALKQAFGL